MKQVHVFFKKGKLYLIPELPENKREDSFVVDGFDLEQAKANVLPVVNPEVITTDEVPGEPGKPYEVGKLYEWPGTWIATALNAFNEPIAAKLIAPQQSQADKTDNELIAEFMGYKQHGDWCDLRWYEESYLKYGTDPTGTIPTKTREEYYAEYVWSPYAKTWQPTQKKDLRYDKSWDWLMPVVEKIYNNNPRAFKVDLFSGPLSPLAKLNIYSPIAEVYKEVVEFIKWYNTQPKQL